MVDRIRQLMDQYAGFSMRAGEDADIKTLQYLPFEEPAEQPPANGRLVLVLVEARVLSAIDGLNGDSDLLWRLERFKGDLRAEGMHTRFIAADLYDGDLHKDGDTLLALRRFLIDVREQFSRFEGVVLVGSFPEASLVRRWSWASPHGNSNPRWTGGTPHLTIVPEPVSPRSEIVLADLTGRWEHLYHRQIQIQAWLGNPTDDMGDSWRDGETILDCTFTSNDYATGFVEFKDCFYIDDANYTVRRHDDNADPKLTIRVRTPLRHPEVAPEDRSSVNITARPDIAVSRINASNLAYDPDPTKVGRDGDGFLDAAGNPNVVPTTRHSLMPSDQKRLFSSFNPALERKLYNRYFDRNHAFRIGGWSNEQFRAGAISGSSDFAAASYVGVVKEAATDFSADLLVDLASPVDYVNFLKSPSVFKYVVAHSGPTISEFDGSYAADDLEAACGGKPFRWKYSDQAFRPSFEDQGKQVDWYVHRALFHHNTLAEAPACLMIHGGCDVNTVAGTHSNVHGDIDYARWQNAEGILFGSTAVALLSRAKTFNDAPWGMGTGLGAGNRANFGNAWRHYYETQAGDARLAPRVVQNKRAYFWSITGDWTLRLRNKNGMGLLGLEGDELEDRVIHPNQAWIGDWNFDAARDKHRGTGSYDGTGQDSIVVQSDWGIGIVKHDGTRWRSLMTAPKDSWFGDWRWDASVNAGRDRVRGTGRFTGSGHDELLVSSSWGLGVLRLAGDTMRSTRTYETGTRIGGWVYDVRKTRHQGIGQFDPDGHTGIVVSSGWGLGILSLKDNRDTAMHASGDRLGGWVLDTASNRVLKIADFDGDGQDEILIKSGWGLGVLKVVNGQLTSVALHAWGSNLGDGCVLGERDPIRLTGRFLGGEKHQLLIAKDDAWFVLSLEGDQLRAVTKLEDEQRYGGWRFSAGSNFTHCAMPIVGNNKDQIVVRSAWGLGVLEVDERSGPTCHALHPFGDKLGRWQLASTDYIAGPCKMTTAGSASLMVWKRRP